ncbi:HAL/PAL/TAL family ammonia-lyase [Fusibacter sp. JL216-2]|uniref:HAL/PAL/TAL family ammonia-lyase n=1 Tax=Fusibacter sp. JL216-2 TaxID=3071453 RepID=UPI003D3403EE
MVKDNHLENIDSIASNTLVLGEKISVTDLVNVARHGYKIQFSQAYKNRVIKSRNLVEKWIDEGRVMYGITTGFGALSTCLISKEETERLQRNIILSHATSVGRPLEVEEVRAIMLCMLQSLGQGYSGVSLNLLEAIRTFLNAEITPYAPGDGSVGYLSVEGHIGLSLIGLGKVYYKGQLETTQHVLEALDLSPVVLGAKEGLALISGTTSPTGLAGLAIYDMLQAVQSADVIGAMCLEVTKGTLRAFDERLMSVKPYKEQGQAASNVRRVLKGSQIAQKHLDYRLQDALSMRALPQLHGASRRALNNALEVVEEELNFTGDNPIIWQDEDGGQALSGCHCDASYVGVQMDASAIAATMVAKISERRNYRMTTSTHSEMPWFLIKNPGVNSGLMIPQYSQAGLVNEMKMLSTPAVVDSIPTCGGQEDYVSMGYNASRKAMKVAEKLEYVLAIELLSAYQAHQFMEGLNPSPAVKALIEEIGKTVPMIEEDTFIQPYIEDLKKLIHSGKLLAVIEKITGELE